MISSLLIASRGEIVCCITRRALAAILLATTASCAAAAPSGAENRSLTHDGVKRTYMQVVPAACRKPQANCALVFGFHGGGLPGVSGKQFDKQTGLGAAAMERGFIAIMPDALGTNWNDGRPEVSSKVDDVGFVRAMLAAVKVDKLTIDNKRIFATGMSNGGHMSFRLACEMPDSFAAIAPVVASLGKALSEQCKPKQAISILNIVGDADPITPYVGGKIGLEKGGSRGEGLSSDASMAFWLKANGCNLVPATSRFDTDPKDRTAVRIDRYSGCAAGKKMERYVVEGGGHLWPGEVPRKIVAMISGRPTREFSGTDVVLDFFGIMKGAQK